MKDKQIDYQERLLIIMPVYNEQDCLKGVIEEWHLAVPFADFLYINDGSRDSTGDILEKESQEYDNVLFINRENRGHGPTIRQGYQYAIDHGYDWVFQCDSDGQVPAIDFGQFWEARHYESFVLGNRFVREDGIGRKIITRVLKFVTFLCLGQWLKDANVPFRLMKVSALKKVLHKVPEEFFLTNVIISTLAKKYQSIYWIPIVFRPRQGGIPSITWKRFISIGKDTILEFLKLRKSL